MMPLSPFRRCALLLLMKNLARGSLPGDYRALMHLSTRRRAAAFLAGCRRAYIRQWLMFSLLTFFDGQLEFSSTAALSAWRGNKGACCWAGTGELQLSTNVKTLEGESVIVGDSMEGPQK